MSKLPKDERVCVMCEYYDELNEGSWCKNPKGAYYGQVDYHVGDVGCSRFKEWKDLDDFKEPRKPSYGNGYVSNIWDEWQKRAYRKGLYHE